MSLTPPDAGPIQDAWLVIPLFNEATVITDVIAGARETFPNIVCVDDNSADGSGQAARDAGAVVVTHPFNLGQGAALQTGIDYVLRATNATYVVTFDADGQHRVEDAVAMIERAREEDVAIVFGSRFLDGRTKPGFLRRIVLKGAVWITNMQTGLRLSDAHNGLRVIRRDAAAGLHLEQNRMAHATEIVLQLSRTKLSWTEHPVLIVYTDYSRSKGQSLMNSINILIDTIVK
ncbi:glycosyltransferase family 2 protein [Ornithinimicrobium faecis]|uniref:Glycosyltransferase family 2 protein n=1 Tax=Ornithinimicrobium faecis TaxID=2934158 RepID=A0ABY4YYJ4_9MICO|nr:glycosyltransferase family 2 protein [Ornithinimicrobium sp. HY1793]USQ81820.1 glycosyltransferase family 2 protein [Ornithinimicrobium sp. HY1793]